MSHIDLSSESALPDVHEKQIDAADLMADLIAHLQEIDSQQTVYIVHLGDSGDDDHTHFVLGPEAVCGKVIGLYSEEYGWPAIVDAAFVKDISVLAPGYHRHPYVTYEGACLAVGVHVSEYDEIKKQYGTSETKRIPR